MGLTIEQREREGILILDLVGRLTLGPEDVAFRTAIQARLAAGQTKIALNCQRLGLTDSAGLGSLIFRHAKLRRAGVGPRS
jgi:anti-anti-sigma regulatory factor